jgi:hypothetical protein
MRAPPLILTRAASRCRAVGKVRERLGESERNGEKEDNVRNSVINVKGNERKKREVGGQKVKSARERRKRDDEGIKENRGKHIKI